MRIRSVALCAALLGCCAAVPLSDWHDGIAVRPASNLSQDMLGVCHATPLWLRLLRGGALTPSRAAQTNYGGAQDGMSPYTPSFGTLEVLHPLRLAPDLHPRGVLRGLLRPWRPPCKLQKCLGEAGADAERVVGRVRLWQAG